MPIPALVVLILIIALPLLEIALLIKVGAAIGVLWTIALVVGTAILGVLVLRSHSLALVKRALDDVQAGQPPVSSVIDGALTILSGVCLILPGPITDTIGAILLLPPVRWGLAKSIAARANVVTVRVRRGTAYGSGQGRNRQWADADSADVENAERDGREDRADRPIARRTVDEPIEASYERVEDREVPPVPPQSTVPPPRSRPE